MAMRPSPVPSLSVCSVCELPWGDHQSSPSGRVALSECVRLLKAALAERPLLVRSPYSTVSYNYPSNAQDSAWGTAVSPAPPIYPGTTFHAGRGNTSSFNAVGGNTSFTVIRGGDDSDPPPQRSGVRV